MWCSCWTQHPPPLLPLKKHQICAAWAEVSSFLIWTFAVNSLNSVNRGEFAGFRKSDIVITNNSMTENQRGADWKGRNLALPLPQIKNFLDPQTLNPKSHQTMVPNRHPYLWILSCFDSFPLNSQSSFTPAHPFPISLLNLRTGWNPLRITCIQDCIDWSYHN